MIHPSVDAAHLLFDGWALVFTAVGVVRSVRRLFLIEVQTERHFFPLLSNVQMKPRIELWRQTQHKTLLPTLRIRKRGISRLPQNGQRAVHDGFVVGHLHAISVTKKNRGGDSFWSG